MKRTLLFFCLCTLIASGCGNQNNDYINPTVEFSENSVEDSSAVMFENTEEKQTVIYEDKTECFTEEERSFFHANFLYQPDYTIEEWQPCFGEQLFYRDLPIEIRLSDGRRMKLAYDQNKWLTDIMIDEESVYHFDWEYDVYTGKVHLKGMMHDGIEIIFEDRWVTKNSWRGESVYQPYNFKEVENDKIFSFHLSPGEDFLIDGIYVGLRKLIQIEYENNIPVMTYTSEWDKLTDSQKEMIQANCRLMDGVVYIRELEAYYAPDRFLIDAKSGSILGSSEEFEEASYIPMEFEHVEEKGDEVWTAKDASHIYQPILLFKKLSDGRVLELLYGGDDYSSRLLIQKRIDGETVSTYRWKRNQYGAGKRVSAIITNGVKVDYLYAQYKQNPYLLYAYYGFCYNNRVYQCYYHTREASATTGDPYLSIYCGNEEIVCYDMLKNVLRGTTLPVDVDILFEAAGEETGFMYVEELGGLRLPRRL